MRRLAACVACALLLAASSITALAGGAVLNPANGHYYSVMFSEQISWADAQQQASETNLGDCKGYLATLTSAAENDFILAAFGDQIGQNSYGYWLGGYQDPDVYPADEGWQWVTGEPWGYTNWAAGEPTDANGPASEQHLEFFINGSGAGVWNDEEHLPNIRGYVVECAPTARRIAIDIRPGSRINLIRLSADPWVPVGILTTPDFDAASVNPATVQFAGAPAFHWTLVDLEFDGDLDLKLQFETRLLNLDPKSVEGTLTGQTFEGKAVLGKDAVVVVP
jgi:hypothetical protein